MYLYLKTVHIIFIVTWFAGLFYFPRLLIYDVEARLRPAVESKILVEQFRIMQKRLLFGITWPSMVITIVLGIWLKTEAPHINWGDSWFVIKLIFVSCLIFYHLSLHKIYNDLRRDKVRVTGTFLRIWNEVATVFLIAIVFLVEFQNTLSMLYGLAGLFVLIALLMSAIKIYKLLREKNAS